MDDLISRQAETCDYWDSESNYCALNKPSAQERKTGKWLERKVIPMYENGIELQSCRCSRCGKYHTTPYLYYFDDFPYCPNCGAEMKGEEDGKDITRGA